MQPREKGYKKKKKKKGKARGRGLALWTDTSLDPPQRYPRATRGEGRDAGRGEDTGLPPTPQPKGSKGNPPALSGVRCAVATRPPGGLRETMGPCELLSDPADLFKIKTQTSAHTHTHTKKTKKPRAVMSTVRSLSLFSHHLLLNMQWSVYLDYIAQNEKILNYVPFLFFFFFLLKIEYPVSNLPSGAPSTHHSHEIYRSYYGTVHTVLN